MAHGLIDALAAMNVKEAPRIVGEMLDRGEDPFAILELCSEAMAIVGDRFEEGSYFLPELITAGEMLKAIVRLIEPKLTAVRPPTGRPGVVVLGTVRGDIHDIGKDIVGLVLRVNGFVVTDLGINVSEQTFVQAVRQVRPDVLGLSGFLSLAVASMKSTVEAIERVGLREGLKVVIGGGPMDDTVCAVVGADAYAADAMAALAFAMESVSTS